MKSCLDLLDEYRNKPQPKGEKLIFEGAGNKDVYNITAPFKLNGQEYLVGRVESRHADWSNDWSDSKIMFFTPYQNRWVALGDIPTFNLEDPFTSFINGEVVLGGVEVFPSIVEGHKIYKYRTVFYKGKGIGDLKKFAVGPDGMKDIRFANLADGQLGVFTRPQDRRNGNLGQIAFTKIPSLNDLTAANINQAQILDGLFLPTEWGGANEVHPLSDDLVGVLGHIAREDQNGVKHYFSIAFKFDLKSSSYFDVKLIASRDNFPDGVAKYPVLQNVIFTGGLIRHEGRLATLYAGLSDAEAGRISIEDPF